VNVDQVEARSRRQEPRWRCSLLLWLNRTSYKGVGDGTVGYDDDEFLSAVNSYNLASICNSLVAILNAKFLPAAVTQVRRITVGLPSP